MFLIETDTPLTRVTLSPLLNPHSLLTSLDYSTGFEPCLSTCQCRSTQGCPVLKPEGFGQLCTVGAALCDKEGLQD